MRLIGDGTAVASCPMLCGGGFLPDAARRWLVPVTSYPMLRGVGFLPDVARRWLLAGGFVVICCHG